MRLRFGPWLALALCAGLAAGAAPVRALEEDEGLGFELTPPRLAYIDGDVSFWRSGAEAWTPARVNTALAAGDELYAAEEASLELQVGRRAFVRAGEERLRARVDRACRVEDAERAVGVGVERFGGQRPPVARRPPFAGACGERDS